MITDNQKHRSRLSIDVAPEFKRKIKVAAIQKDLSMRDYVVTILQQAITDEENKSLSSENSAWLQLSRQTFARDWNSEEDSVYDNLL